MRTLQIAIMVIFGVFILIAILSFAGFIPSPGGRAQKQLSGKLALWGTENKDVMDQYIGKVAPGLGDQTTIVYTQKSENTFDSDIIEALASGTGPDMIILPEDLIIRMQSKIVPFTPETYQERDFKNSFIQNGEIFIQPKGILALPIAIDPLVMYWNRSIFTNKSIPLPPKYWDEFLTLAPTLTEKDETNTIKSAAISFGGYQNVTNAKDILATLILQSGNPLMMRVSGKLQPTLSGLSQTANQNIPPISQVLQFYTDFSDPAKNIYSWSGAMPESKQAFLAGNLAVYFGFASEFSDLRLKNPNLNFDVAPVPQIRNISLRSTYGKVEGIAILNASQQKIAAIYVAKYLASPDNTALFASLTGKVSPSREVLAKSPSDPNQKVFYDSTIISQSWLDPNKEKTNDIFQSAVQNIDSGKTPVQTSPDVVQQLFLLTLNGNE